MDLTPKHLVVIGGGAAGFFCAVNAARLNPGLQVTILEKSNKCLSKVSISGGGRCNCTHACFEISEMVKKYPRGQNFLKKTFHQFFTNDTIQWFKERGVALKTEADGRMFPVSNTASTIVDCLLKEADKYNVKVWMHAAALEIRTVVDVSNTDLPAEADRPKRFKIRLAVSGKPSECEADTICFACGGYPKTNGYDWLKELGHSIAEPVPSLFTFNMPGNRITNLMGVSVENSIVKIAGTKLETAGPLLVTHWGLSGPAILKLSAWGARILAEKKYNFKAIVNWLPHIKEPALRVVLQQLRTEIAGQKIMQKNPFGLPQRLWEYFLEQSGIPEALRWADLPAVQQNKLIKNLLQQEFEINGKTGFKEEFVTAGGIQLTEVDANTMESKIQKGLYFAGEILDVDGLTGGFNFQHAWTSGWIAAKSIAAQNGG